MIQLPTQLDGIDLSVVGTILQGDSGPQGIQGLTAYQLWIAEGNTGTVQDFLAALIGPVGPAGANGTDGADGEPIELQKSLTHLQYRVVGSPTWIDLVLLSEITGPAGADGVDGIDGTNGTNGINGTNGVDGADGADGRGITTIVRTAGTGAAGTVDTYTITFTDATTTTFQVRNGADGLGSGDMAKTTYDSNNDGKVNAADVADAAPWSGITGKPAVIAEGANQAAARTAINAEAAIAAGTADQYLNGSKSWVDFATSVRGSVLTGLSVATNAVIAAGDSVLGAFGKLQAQITAHFGSGGAAHSNAVAGGNAGFMTGADKTKLDGVAAGATANSSDATLLARANHTGTQPLSTIAATGGTNGQMPQLVGGVLTYVNAPSGAGLTTVHVTGTTATYTAAVGEMVSIESTVAVVVTAPPGLTAGQKWGVMVCNDRWDNSVAMNGNKHENISDATMTLKDNKIVVEFEMISTSFGQKVKML